MVGIRGDRHWWCKIGGVAIETFVTGGKVRLHEPFTKWHQFLKSKNGAILLLRFHVGI